MLHNIIHYVKYIHDKNTILPDKFIIYDRRIPQTMYILLYKIKQSFNSSFLLSQPINCHTWCFLLSTFTLKYNVLTLLTGDYKWKDITKTITTVGIVAVLPLNKNSMDLLPSLKLRPQNRRISAENSQPCTNQA